MKIWVRDWEELSKEEQEFWEWYNENFKGGW